MQSLVNPRVLVIAGVPDRGNPLCHRLKIVGGASPAHIDAHY